MRAMTTAANRTWLVSVALALLGAGCKERRAPPRPAPAMRAPAELLGHLAVRAPARVADRALALLGRFVEPPVNRDQLLGELLAQARLPRALLPLVDTARPLRVVALSARQLDEAAPGLLALPLRSAARFRAVLAREMTRRSAAGGLARYAPRADGGGAGEVLVGFADEHALLPTSERAFAVAAPFVVRTLLARHVAHDLELHLVAGQIRRDSAGTGSGEASVDALLARLRGRAKAGAEASRLAGLQAALRGLLAPLLLAEELRVTADLSPEGVTLAARAEGGKNVAWTAALAGQRPGAPFRHAALPRDGMLVIADRREEARGGHALAALDAALPVLLRDEPSRQRFAAALQRLGAALAAERTLSLHRPTSGAGLVACAVARLRADRREDAARRAAAATAALRAAMLSELRASRPRVRPRVTEETFSAGEARGRVLRVALPLDDEGDAIAVRLFGTEPALAWALLDAARGQATGEAALLVCGGRDADLELRARVAAASGAGGGGGLLANPTVAAAFRRPGRVGLVYLSLVELVRELSAARVPGLEPFARDLRGVRVSDAPTLDWGVDSNASALDVRLRIPASHFVPFKPFFKALAQPQIRRLPVLPPE